MENLLTDLLKQQLSSAFYEKAGKSLGLDSQSTQNLAQKALPFILSGMAKNTQDEKGAENLLKAITSEKHDGHIFDDLESLIANPQGGEGDGILENILGNKTNSAEAMLDKENSLQNGSSKKMMEILAPIVMGALGKTQRAQNWDAKQLAAVVQFLSNNKDLGGAAKDLAIKFLDKDGDGDYKDDLLNMGKNWLMNKLKKK